jgi:hypothetical protein
MHHYVRAGHFRPEGLEIKDIIAGLQVIDLNVMVLSNFGEQMGANEPRTPSYEIFHGQIVLRTFK